MKLIRNVFLFPSYFIILSLFAYKGFNIPIYTGFDFRINEYISIPSCIILFLMYIPVTLMAIFLLIYKKFREKNNAVNTTIDCLVILIMLLGLILLILAPGGNENIVFFVLTFYFSQLLVLVLLIFNKFLT